MCGGAGISISWGRRFIRLKSNQAKWYFLTLIKNTKWNLLKNFPSISLFLNYIALLLIFSLIYPHTHTHTHTQTYTRTLDCTAIPWSLVVYMIPGVVTGAQIAAALQGKFSKCKYMCTYLETSDITHPKFQFMSLHIIFDFYLSKSCFQL